MIPPVSYQNVWKRAVVSALVGMAGVFFLLLTRHFEQGGHTDFSVVWQGSRILWQGRNPYLLIGPGREFGYPWELHYPASTLVAVTPLALLPEYWADIVFVFVSGSLLFYGATKENWNRIWIFPSAAFIIASRAGQWSPLIGSGLFLPWMGWVVALKPSTGLAVFASIPKKYWLPMITVGMVLCGIAIPILPDWPNDWYNTIRGSWEFTSPVSRLGGFLMVLSLLRWRQKEAKFLFVLALVPQVSSWYEGLLPLLVGRTKRECQILSLTSSLGYLLLIPLALQSPTHEVASSVVGRMMVAFCYLPALIVVLRRDEVQQG